MNIQHINISKVVNRDYYLNKYGIDKSDFTNNLFAIEIRNFPHSEISSFGLFLKENEIKYYLSLQDSNLNSYFLFEHYSEALKIFSKNEHSNRNKYITKIKNILSNYSIYENKEIDIKDNIYKHSSVYVMGIINVTPDSFSDGGKYFSHNKAVNRAIEMIDSGVDIVDVGGESTRPDADIVSVGTEIERVIPVIKEIIGKRPDSILSIDTTKSKVAALALEAGASIINDVSAFAFDKEIIDVANSFNVPYILMHMKGNPRTMQGNPFYDDVVSKIYDFLFEKIKVLKKKGINKIIVDPGIGFGKRVVDNIELIKRLSEFKGLGYPILIGLSRKSFIGKTLNLDVDNRDVATIIEETHAVSNGATFIRTHNTNYALQMKKLFNYNKELETVVL